MEEEKTEEEEEEKPVEEPKLETKSTEIIDAANAAAERLEKATEAMNKASATQAEIIAKAALGGSSEGGMGQTRKPPMTDEEYANAAISGELELKDGA